MRIDKGGAGSEDAGCSSEQAEKAKWQTLSLQQLNDLQSKLMLVAGKAAEGKEQVDRFVEVIQSVIFKVLFFVVSFFCVKVIFE